MSAARLWYEAHDALREYHRLRGMHASTSVVDKAWRAYQRAKAAAEASNSPEWRGENDVPVPANGGRRPS